MLLLYMCRFKIFIFQSLFSLTAIEHTHVYSDNSSSRVQNESTMHKMDLSHNNAKSHTSVDSSAAVKIFISQLIWLSPAT